jgi:hypothetical protein
LDFSDLTILGGHSMGSAKKWVQPEQYEVVGAALEAARRKANLSQVELAALRLHTRTPWTAAFRAAAPIGLSAMVSLPIDVAVSENFGGDTRGDFGYFNWRKDGDNGRDLGSHDHDPQVRKSGAGSRSGD